MCGEAAAFVRSWRVGSRTCTLTLPAPRPGEPQHTAIDWTPSTPNTLSAAEWRQYRSGRNAALEELAAEMGITVAVIEL